LQMAFNIFSSTLCTRLGFPHPMVHRLFLMHMHQTHRFDRDMPTFSLQYCDYNEWHSHFGRCNHCWFDLCKFCFVNFFFLGHGHDDCSLGKGCVILWPTIWKCFYSFCNKDIWMFTPTSWWFLSLMCQHSMVDKRLWKTSSLDFTFIL
jgi:hypothetical protein